MSAHLYLSYKLHVGVVQHDISWLDLLEGAGQPVGVSAAVEGVQDGHRLRQNPVVGILGGQGGVI